MFRCTISACGLSFATGEERADHMQYDYHCPYCGWSDQKPQNSENLNELCSLCKVPDDPHKENA